MRRRHALLAAGALLCAPLAAAFAQEPTIAAEKPAEWLLLERIADARGFRAEFDAVPSHLARMVEETAPAFGAPRLQRVLRALAQPWSVPQIGRELRDGLAAGLTDRAGLDLGRLLAHAADAMDLTSPHESERLREMDSLWLRLAPVAADAEPAVRAAETVNAELLALLSQYLGLAHAELAAGCASWSEAERALLLGAGFPAWCEAFHRIHFPQGTISEAQAAHLAALQAFAPKAERARLLAVAARVARLTEPAFLDALPRRLGRCPRDGSQPEGFEDVIASAGTTAADRVVLLGRGKSRAAGRAALVVDLGGDDEWTSAAVADAADALVAVVLDLSGNDRYASAGPGPAYAAGGVALLADVRGRDEYRSQRLGQGAAALGLAALLDLDGDDRYSAQDFSQGYAHTGIALLLDRAGDDAFSAWAYAQGAGNGPGYSALADGAGDDRYVANGQWPDVYGDSGPDSFHGASQGYSFGFREGERLLPGGIAVFADFGMGKDFYESGNFSQGGAYFFGLGLMYDGGGNDENRGYRYSQGFGVHQAVGMRWDAGGDDVYLTRCAANCGAAWDEGVGWLWDESGNDRYEVGGLALGGAANTAVAVLVDGGGDDAYGGGGGADAQGGTGDSSYHQKQSIGALLDLGGGKDSYTRVGRGDGRILNADWHGIFVDVKEKSAAALLTSRELARLLSARD